MRVSLDGCRKSHLPPGFNPQTVQPITNLLHPYIHKYEIQGHRKRWTGFSESTITGVVYLDLREHYVFPQIETFKQETVSRVIFMQDGAPPHFSCFVTDILNERFPDAWIGRGGPIPWPP